MADLSSGVGTSPYMPLFDRYKHIRTRLCCARQLLYLNMGKMSKAICGLPVNCRVSREKSSLGGRDVVPLVSAHHLMHVWVGDDTGRGRCSSWYLSSRDCLFSAIMMASLLIDTHTRNHWSQCKCDLFLWRTDEYADSFHYQYASLCVRKHARSTGSTQPGYLINIMARQIKSYLMYEGITYHAFNISTLQTQTVALTEWSQKININHWMTISDF